jgi:hypothetical protein
VELATARNLYSVFGLMAINNEPLELNIGNLVRSYLTCLHTRSMKSYLLINITNIAMVIKVDIMSDKCYIDKTYTSVILFSRGKL